MILFDSEKSLENFIIEEFEKDYICLIDNEEYDECISQFDAKAYGIPDLVFTKRYQDIDENDNVYDRYIIHIVELKNEPIKNANLAQIARYKTYFERAYSGFSVEVRSSLVVPKSVDRNDDTCWIINHLDEIYVYEFTLNPSKGIEFKTSSGWYRTKEDFEPALALFELDENKRKNF